MIHHDQASIGLSYACGYANYGDGFESSNGYNFGNGFGDGDGCGYGSGYGSKYGTSRRPTDNTHDLATIAILSLNLHDPSRP